MTSKNVSPYRAYQPVKSRALFGLEPGPAWIAIIALFGMTLLLSFAGLGVLLRFLYPLAALGVGIFLYSRYPILYLGFNWWIWFLTPLLRRIADQYSSFDSKSLMLTAPYLVTSVTAMTMLKDVPNANRHGTLPFNLAALGILYSFFIGYTNDNSLMAIARSLLDWLPPVIFGFYIARQWRHYPAIRRNTQRCFIWATLIMGLYGIFQYLVAPQWDRSWLINVDLVSLGRPEAQEMRVWSTLNSPTAFSAVMMSGLMLLFTDSGFLRVPAAIAGFLSFLLSQVRAAWGGWIVGIFMLLGALRSNTQMRFIVALISIAVCVMPVTQVEPFNEVIQSRIESLSDGKSDSSFKARANTYAANMDAALSQIVGRGLGSTWSVAGGSAQRVALDSGILDTFFTLGWIGGIPYVGGLILLMRSQFSGDESLTDRFYYAIRSITVSIISMLVLGPFMTGISGLCLWGFLGINVAARKFYGCQRKQLLVESEDNILFKS